MNSLEEFARHFPRRKYTAGTKLFTNESQPSFFLYLIEGAIQMSQTDKDGKVIKLHAFHPGSMLSLLSLVESGDSYDFEVVEDAEVYQIPRKDFFLEARQNSEFTLTLLTHTMKGIKGLLYRVHSTVSTPAYQRVAGLLVYFARHAQSVKEEETLVIKTTHQEIAEWLGLTRENVTLQLKKLEDEGLIKRLQRAVEIISISKLQKLSQ